jgi:hypothetical protein
VDGSLFGDASITLSGSFDHLILLLQVTRFPNMNPSRAWLAHFICVSVDFGSINRHVSFGYIGSLWAVCLSLRWLAHLR